MFRRRSCGLPRRDRKSFILMEVMCALLLLIMLFPALLQGLFWLQNERQASSRKMVMKAIAREAFCDLKEQLYEDRLKCEGDFFAEMKGELGVYRLPLSTETERPWRCSYRLIPSERYLRKESGDHYLLVDAEITLTLRKKKETFIYPFVLMVEKKK